MKKFACTLILIIMVFFLGMSLIQDAWSAEEKKVTIKRDTYGVPHIYADTVYGLFYGYGYAIAQDRLFQMEILKHAGQGRVAEVLGEKYIAFDKKIRSNYKPDSIKEQLVNLSENDKAVFEGYSAGINAWLKEVRQNSEKYLPKQFNDFGFHPTSWTSFDVAMIFVGSMVNRFGDYNTELENQMILDMLVKKHGEKVGREIFNQLVPLTVKGAPTTIPSGEWEASNTTSLKKSALNLQHSRYALNEAMSDQFFAPGTAFSNCTVIGAAKARYARSILMNGPQFGWYNPSYVYSVGLHGPGFNVVGNTPFGYPVILFGHNEHIAWGSTWGAGDLIDIYREELNPDNPEEYKYNGKYQPMEKRLEIIKVKGGQDVQLEVYRTIHGPIIKMDKEKKTAYAKKRTWEGFEIDTLLGWMHSTRAANWGEWLKQAERSAINVNMYYADEEGNIGYAFTGKYPERCKGHDNRLPVPGTGAMEWENLKPFKKGNPHILNPKQGYIVNWNNKPADGVLNPDMFWYSWSKADRVNSLIEMIESKKSLSPDDVWDIIQPLSFVDVNARYFVELIDQATANCSDTRIKQIANELVQWEHMSRDGNRDEKYDELSTTVFRTFLTHMIKNTLQDDLGDAFKFFASAAYPTPKEPYGSGLNLGIGTKAIVESLQAPEEQAYDFFNGKKPEVIILESLRSSIAQLEAEMGPDLKQWRLPTAPNVLGNKNFLGIPQANPDESLVLNPGMNRGTENNMTIFTSEGIIAYEVAPPGQSGFISIDGTQSEHYRDQVSLYQNFGRKRVWFYAGDVERNKKSETELRY